MPRPRTGLGQGLEALVPPLRDSGSPIASIRPSTDAVTVTWEIGTLRKRRRGRCVFTVAPSNILQEPRTQKLKSSTLLALGALGASGWELTALDGRTFYLKRPVTVPPQ
jgi:hypothetical protein